MLLDKDFYIENGFLAPEMHHSVGVREALNMQYTFHLSSGCRSSASVAIVRYWILVSAFLWGCTFWNCLVFDHHLGFLLSISLCSFVRFNTGTSYERCWGSASLCFHHMSFVKSKNVDHDTILWLCLCVCVPFCNGYVDWLYPGLNNSNLTFNYKYTVYFTWTSSITDPWMNLWCAPSLTAPQSSTYGEIQVYIEPLSHSDETKRRKIRKGKAKQVLTKPMLD